MHAIGHFLFELFFPSLDFFWLSSSSILFSFLIFPGTAIAEEHSPSSSVPSSGEAISSATAASPPRFSLAAGTARANSMGGVERKMMQEMPGVFTKGLPNGNKVEGILYNYRKGGDVRIVCICHGSFLTPSEFVEHAGAGKVEHPLRHIVVSSFPTL